MSGGSSGATGGFGPGPLGADAPVGDFAQSDQAKGLSKDRIDALNYSYFDSTAGIYKSKTGDDLTDVVNAYRAWATATGNQKTAFTKYATLANGQEGRDATILTGPEQNPNTILGKPGGPTNLQYHPGVPVTAPGRGKTRGPGGIAYGD